MTGSAIAHIHIYRNTKLGQLKKYKKRKEASLNKKYKMAFCPFLKKPQKLLFIFLFYSFKKRVGEKLF